MPPVKFDRKLILNQWILSLFEVASFEELSEGMKIPELEGFDENNISRFFHVLAQKLFDRKHLPKDLLLAYDQNIFRHWKRICEKRNLSGNILRLKYFQYISLLFTEIYLDRYFQDPDAILAQLNELVMAHNAEHARQNQIAPYILKDLNKIAFWMATGSGKTLLMHVNILQYEHYLKRYGRRNELNRIILLTPNEGLSRQHLNEFALSNITADLFAKNGQDLFSTRKVEIIDIHKLREEAGDKTVAVESFEGNNLVMVDEGHRGTSSAETGQWMKRREALCENGFSFEYSATFGQAVKASTNRELEQIYAKCILVDYSYKYFYHDGYGKEFRILNLTDDDFDYRQKYLTACLLSFYQQQSFYEIWNREWASFLLEKPLCVFVGGKVNAVRTENRRKVSDVVDILLFLADFARPKNKQVSIRLLELLLSGKAGLLDANGNNLFAGSFSSLTKKGVNAQKIYQDILRLLFNASAPAALHVNNLKGADGEIALSLGDNQPFGVINVGDTAKLAKLCADQDELVVGSQEFSGSLFHAINEPGSQIHILIGSKKFTEGWSSWRVSTMGLMNVGKKEGSQIIQLFGRGVRLKGKDFCLQRTSHILGQAAPKDIEKLETLNIFGVKADYMRQFKEYLEEEGLPTDDNHLTFVLPVVKGLNGKKLKIVKLKDGVDYKRQGKKPTLGLPDEQLRRQPITLDWFPKIQALASAGSRKPVEQENKQPRYFEEKHLAFIDFAALYLELQEFKNERTWFNLNLDRNSLKGLFADPAWYQIFIPEDELAFTDYGKVRQWQEIASALLKKYCHRYYTRCKAAWEKDHLEYRELREDDPNFIKEYKLMVDRSREDIIARLEEVKRIVENGELRDMEIAGLHSIMFSGHLYQPLLHVNSDAVKVKPVALNHGEKEFVLDLKRYCTDEKDFFAHRELYLLRNMSRGRGIGFFEAGNFYPDFILWVVEKDRQIINFVDPKGLRNTDGENSPKIRFSKTIKELEQQLGDPAVMLNSFIISTTPPHQIDWWGGGMKKEEFDARHVLFQYDDKNTYISRLLNKAVA